MDSQMLSPLEYTRPNATPHSSHTTVANKPSGRSVRKQLITLRPTLEIFVVVVAVVAVVAVEEVEEEEVGSKVMPVVAVDAAVVSVAGNNPSGALIKMWMPILSSTPTVLLGRTLASSAEGTTMSVVSNPCP